MAKRYSDGNGIYKVCKCTKEEGKGYAIKVRTSSFATDYHRIEKLNEMKRWATASEAQAELDRIAKENGWQEVITHKKVYVVSVHKSDGWHEIKTTTNGTEAKRVYIGLYNNRNGNEFDGAVVMVTDTLKNKTWLHDGWAKSEEIYETIAK